MNLENLPRATEIAEQIKLRESLLRWLTTAPPAQTRSFLYGLHVSAYFPDEEYQEILTFTRRKVVEKIHALKAEAETL